MQRAHTYSFSQASSLQPSSVTSSLQGYEAFVVAGMLPNKLEAGGR